MRLIDADELMERLENRYCNDCRAKGLDYQGVKCRACAVGDELDDIDDAPTVDSVKHGHWELCGTIGKIQVGVCSSCKFKFAVGGYCGICGATMDEVSE